MAEIPGQRTPTTTALAHLLEAHRSLVRFGFEPQAQVLATALLDRMHVTDGGSGVVEPITSGESLVIAQRVIGAVAPGSDRQLVREIMLGLSG